MALGKTVMKTKMIDPFPGSQMESRKARLPQYIEGSGLEEKNYSKNMNNMEIKHLALKSYRRRSISQANKKVSSERERISKLLDPHKK